MSKELSGRKVAYITEGFENCEGDVKSVESSSGDEAEKDRDNTKGAQTPKSQPPELFESFQV